MIHHITRATRILIFWSLIASALGLTAIRFFLSGLENYKSELEREIGTLINAPVEIGRIKTGMRAITPELLLKDIKILGEEADSPTSSIKFEEIRLNIDLWDVLWTRQLWGSSWITIVGADLTIKRKTDGSFAIAGLQAGAENDRPLWLLQGRKFEFLHSRIAWRNELRGGEPVQFEHVDLVIKNEGDRHQLHMLTRLPENLGDSLRVSMELSGNFFETGDLDGKIYLEGLGINLDETTTGEIFPDGHVKSGFGDLKLWAHWQQGRMAEAAGDVALQGLALTIDGKNDFSVDRLDSLFKWRDDGKRWQLDIGRLQIEDRRRSWAQAQFSLAVERDGSGGIKNIALAAHRLDLKDVSELLVLPGLLPAEQIDRLASIKLAGNLTDFTLFADPDNRRFALDGEFSGLSFAAFDAVPGFTGLAGRIRGNDESGYLQLSIDKAQMELSEQFRQALPIERLQGRIDWRQRLDAWVVSSKQIFLEAPGMPTVSRFTLTVPKEETSPVLELQSAFSVADISQVKNYLPATSIDSDAVAWLDRAFVSGRIPHGGLLVSGALADFPFTEGQGVFEVLFDLSGMTLSYDPEWPNLTEVDATALFYGESLTVDVRKAKTVANSVKKAQITIPSLGDDPHLRVRGVAEGSISGVLDFLQQTPIGSPVGALLGAITPYGNTSVKLGLDIPLAGPGPTKVDGAAALDNASLVVHSFDLPVDRIKGALKFNEQGIYAESINAVTLGSPVQVSIDSEPNQTVVKVAGQAAVDDLQNHFKLPWWHLAEGKTDYRLDLILPADDNGSPQLTIDSELIGVSLALPDVLAKTTEQNRPLSLVFNMNDERWLPVRLNYDNQLHAAFKIDIRRQTLHSGHFLFGSGSTQFSGEPLIKLEANRKQMNLEEWLSFAEGENSANVEPIQVHEIKIKTQNLINKFKDLGSLDLIMTRRNDAWVGKIDSPAAKGDLHIPLDRTGDGKIKLAMDFIDLSELSRIQLNNDSAKPSDLVPLFDIDSEKVIWRSTDLGRLELRTVRIPHGLHFKKLTISDKNEKLNLTGNWLNDGFKYVTELKGTFEGRHFGRLLNELGLYESMKETRVAVQIDVNWDAAPYQFSLTRLFGKLDIELNDGRLLSIEPGLGRILGVMAFSQWLKRLQLDFRDIYKEGLTFNSIKGRIHLADGIASTGNLEVDAVPAKITLSGTANLTEKTLDQQVWVVPKSSDAVPIAGTIVGRLAGLIAKAVTSDYKEGFFFGSQYRIQGSWEQPEVIPLHEDDGLFNKTWKGLTDFPWAEK